MFGRVRVVGNLLVSFLLAGSPSHNDNMPCFVDSWDLSLSLLDALVLEYPGKSYAHDANHIVHKTNHYDESYWFETYGLVARNFAIKMTVLLDERHWQYQISLRIPGGNHVHCYQQYGFLTFPFTYGYPTAMLPQRYGYKGGQLSTGNTCTQAIGPSMPRQLFCDHCQVSYH